MPRLLVVHCGFSEQPWPSKLARAIAHHAVSILSERVRPKDPTLLPLAKKLATFDFAGTPVNEALVRDLATGAFLQQQCNAVLVGGTGSGKPILRWP